MAKVEKNRVKQVVNFNLKHSIDPESEALVYATLMYKGERIKLSTGQKALIKAWNSKTQRAQIDAHYITERQNRANKKLNKFLDQLSEKANKSWEVTQTTNNPNYQTFEYFKYLLKLNIEKLNKGVKEEQEQAQRTPLQFFKECLNNLTNQFNGKDEFIKQGTKTSYLTIYNRLEEFIKFYQLNDSFFIFDKTFEVKFKNWGYTQKKYSLNTISLSIRVIKVWLRQAEDQGLITDNSYKRYKTTTAKTDNVFLTMSEIEAIYSLNIDQLKQEGKILGKQIEITKDLFVISCLTALRYSDWDKLNSALWDISNKQMKILTTKTKQPVNIHLHPIVIEIYQKYRGKFPLPHSLQTSIKHIQKLGELAGIENEILIIENKAGKTESRKYKKYQLLSAHTGRRSFATNLYLKGVLPLQIMEYTGHKSEDNFFKYINLKREANTDVAKIIDNL